MAKEKELVGNVARGRAGLSYFPTTQLHNAKDREVSGGGSSRCGGRKNEQDGWLKTTRSMGKVR